MVSARDAYAWLRRYRVVLSQLGLASVVAFAFVNFSAGLWFSSVLIPATQCAEPCQPKFGVDPCRDLLVDEASGTPHEASGFERVLVTGASGFIGSHLTAKLLELGYHVRVFDNLETGNILFLDLLHPRLEFVHGDILDVPALRSAMDGISGVFHLAAASKVLPSLKDPHMATFNVERNSVGTANVLEVANETKLVRKVVYAGSSTYYGNQPVPFRESDPFMPTSPYAASKYMGELQMLTNDQLYGLPTLNLRYFMVYGPRNPSEGAYAIVTGKFLKQRLEGESLLIEGTGENFRDFIHVDDVARSCILGYQSAVHGTAINIGSGTSYSVKEVAGIFSSNQKHVAARKNDLLGTLADTCRAKRLLHFSARHDFMTTMREMLDDALAGRTDYIAPMWKEAGAESVLEERFPGWAAAPVHQRAAKIKEAMDQELAFLPSLLEKLRGKR